MIKMVNQKRWLSGLAVVAIVGSSAAPMIASAQGAGEHGGSAQTAEPAVKLHASAALATALGVEPAALEAAIKAAIATTPKPTDDKKDPAARDAYRSAFETSLAASLGVTVEQLRAAVESLKSVKAERGGDHEKILGRKLADALGVTPDALAEAVRAARTAVPPLTGEAKRDPAAREAYAAALESAIAQHLGITVEAFNAAQATVKGQVEDRKDEAREKASDHFLQVLDRLVGAGVLTQAQADEILAQYNLGGEAQAQVIKRLRSLLQEQKASDHFLQVLDRLVGAGVLTQAQADEILAQYHLGGEAQAQVIKRLRSLLQEQKANDHFLQVLDRLVGTGVLTQAQADEILAQYNLGGEAQAQVIKRLRSLLQEQKDDQRDGKREEKRERRDEKRPEKKPAIELLRDKLQDKKDGQRDGRREEKRERRDEKRPEKKPAIERLLKQRRSNAS